MRRITRRVAKIAFVPNLYLSAVKNPGDVLRNRLVYRSGHQPTINCMDLDALLTEQANPASAHIDKLSTVEILRVISAEDHKAAEAVAAEIPRIALAVQGIVEAFRNGGRL